MASHGDIVVIRRILDHLDGFTSSVSALTQDTEVCGIKGLEFPIHVANTDVLAIV